jgi:hypothetical protein
MEADAALSGVGLEVWSGITDGEQGGTPRSKFRRPGGWKEANPDRL